jgi:hypothetical protein
MYTRKASDFKNNHAQLALKDDFSCLIPDCSGCRFDTEGFLVLQSPTPTRRRLAHEQGTAVLEQLLLAVAPDLTAAKNTEPCGCNPGAAR